MTLLQRTVACLAPGGLSKCLLPPPGAPCLPPASPFPRSEQLALPPHLVHGKHLYSCGSGTIGVAPPPGVKKCEFSETFGHRNMLILPGVPRTPFTVLEGGKQPPPSSVPRSQCGHRPSAADHPPTFSSLRGAFSFIGTISSHWLHQFGRWRLRFGISHLLHLLSQSKLSFSHSVTFLITCLSQRKVIRISEVMNVENRSLSRVS